MKEKGYYGHGVFLFDELTNVPLLIKFPRGKKIAAGDGYQSLTRIPSLIQDLAIGSLKDISEQTVYSEAYGSQHPLKSSIREDSRDKFRRMYGIKRKSVYKDKYKLEVLDGGKISELTFKGRAINPEEHKYIVDDLLSEIELFKENESFIVR